MATRLSAAYKTYIGLTLLTVALGGTLLDDVALTFFATDFGALASLRPVVCNSTAQLYVVPAVGECSVCPPNAKRDSPGESLRLMFIHPQFDFLVVVCGALWLTMMMCEMCQASSVADKRGSMCWTFSFGSCAAVANAELVPLMAYANLHRRVEVVGGCLVSGLAEGRLERVLVWSFVSVALIGFAICFVWLLMVRLKLGKKKYCPMAQRICMLGLYLVGMPYTLMLGIETIIQGGDTLFWLAAAGFLVANTGRSAAGYVLGRRREQEKMGKEEEEPTMAINAGD